VSIKSERQWITERKPELVVNSKDVTKCLDMLKTKDLEGTWKYGMKPGNLTGKWCAQKRVGSTGNNREGLGRPKFEANIRLEK